MFVCCNKAVEISVPIRSISGNEVPGTAETWSTKWPSRNSGNNPWPKYGRRAQINRLEPRLQSRLRRAANAPSEKQIRQRRREGQRDSERGQDGKDVA